MGFFSKPETVIWKEQEGSRQYLEDLKKLEKELSEEGKKRISEERMRVEQTLFRKGQLLTAFQESQKDLVVLEGMVFEHEGENYLVDFYVVTPKVQFLIFCGEEEERAKEIYQAFRDRKLKRASGFQRMGLETRFQDFYRFLAMGEEAEPQKLLSAMERFNADSGVKKLSRKEMQRSGELLRKACKDAKAYYEERLEAFRKASF